MEPFGSPFLHALADLELEWREIVREHGDLSTQPYDLERDELHEVRLRRYKAQWEHLVVTLVASAARRSDDDTPGLLTLH